MNNQFGKPEPHLAEDARATQAAPAGAPDQLKVQCEKLAAVLASERRQHAVELQKMLAAEKQLREQMERGYLSSTSWRITAPLRMLASLVRSGKLRTAPEEPPGSDTLFAPPTAWATGPTDEKQATRAALKTQFNAFLTSSGILKFDRPDTPDISILLVLYNSVELTYACLNSIASALHGSAYSCELIILDNGSTDETADLLDRIEGAEIIRSQENLHFLRGANRAAALARGKHLLFLNNDALLMPGSLEAAIAAFDEEENVGAVGGRIMLPTGLLQEAGSIVWQDGTCSGYGRDRAPDAPEFMFRRDVDYCSGAFLMTPRAQFERLGGFDTRYEPAYYEETDYCLRLWEAGLRVVFEPSVVILHFEFGSGTSSGAIELQQRNRRLFHERHAESLRGHWPQSPGALIGARTMGKDIKHILYVEDRVPLESLGSGYPRSVEIVQALDAAGTSVTLYPMADHGEDWPLIRSAIPGRVEVMRGHSHENLADFLRSRRDYYDAILISRPHNMAGFLNATNKAAPEFIGAAMLIYDAEAMFAVRTLSQRKLLGELPSQEEAARLIAEEVALTQSADVIISVSESERHEFERHGARSVHVLGHAVVPTPTPRSFEERAGILFVGGIYTDDSPNADSLRWFAREVWPLIQTALGGEVIFHIVGRNRAPSIHELASDSIELVGSVEELGPWYDKARVVVAPTRYAAGIPMKAHTAAAYGTPLVSTTLIAEQLGWRSGFQLLAADDPAEFAAACVRLHTDSKLWQAIRQGALEQVARDCSPERFRSTTQRLVEAIPLVHRSAQGPRSR